MESGSTNNDPADTFTENELNEMLEQMWLIRAFEEAASDLYARGRIRGLLHLGIGQEGSAVGACGALQAEDWVVGGHRSHAHVLAKGADPNRLMAELAGRVTGYCHGKGGSMHIVAADVGFLTATGLVAGNIPLALGAALTGRKSGNVALVFFGDGAGQAGAFHESLNLASLWGLPVVFVCENNGYAEFTPLSAHTKVERLSAYAETYGIPNVTIDGNDVVAVRRETSRAVERAREGGGPSFVECLTYRLRGHYEGDPGRYRELSELAEWKEKDPIARLTTYLASRRIRDDGDAERMARERVAEAVSFAEASEWPSVNEATTQVWVGR